ncbi:hypothetical protein [Pseudonocardia humida]|uniref:Uncharacterized protein n=1 Tax=Pseudonocardia humida TaxID=2800819 RepID=A0ABT0ZTA5_9PSEU|nr:hypothetical protein [Pseudonocardia humida]MCO1653963.1 hypothetical protein [Pseudonocardia humida]
MCDPSPEERRTWSDVVSLWSGWGELDRPEDVTLSWVLAWAAVVETHRFEVREGLLLSLSDLAAGARAPAGVLDLVTSAIAPDDLHVAEVEMYEALVAARARPAAQIPPAERPNLAGSGAGERIGPLPCLDLVRRISSRVPEERRSGAALVGDRAGAGELDDDEAPTLAAVLAWAVEVETTAARPALLSALRALSRRDRVPPWALERVLAHLGGTALDRPEEELRSELSDALAAHRRRAGT